MSNLRFKVAPDVEFYMEMAMDGVDENSRDYDVQQHKEELYREFKLRLEKAFPEGFKIDDFHFGMNHD